ncbi:hypothetical protein LL912_12740 [Niabella sp. CC-SYL272]|uniref:hemerythrin domain-containing protein n=1 Tax=Niabella agricola TaxID=2891571 RepID=UPI001F223E6C|nr:hemerythrin domain-containing protein [Niabella agricola]MCF3109639.1 hypothetical protein [Niabella agricola]
MEQQRFNLFNRAHKALRGLMCSTLIRLQQADLTGEYSLKQCCRDINLVIELLEEHAILEDHYILPSLPPEARSSVLFFEQQHLEDKMLCSNLKELMKKMENATTGSLRASGVPVLLQAYISFAVFNLQHMNMEEQLLNPLLWLKYTDVELEQIVAEAIKKSPSKNHMLFLGLMIEHQNDEELYTWICNIRQTAAAAVFQQLEALSNQVLPEARLNALKQRIKKMKRKQPGYDVR